MGYMARPSILRVNADTFTNWGPKSEYATVGYLWFLMKIWDSGSPFLTSRGGARQTEWPDLSQKDAGDSQPQARRGDNTIMNKHQGKRRLEFPHLSPQDVFSKPKIQAINIY